MSKMRPSSLDITEVLFTKKSFASANKTIVIINDIGISLHAVEDCTVIGYIKPAIPNIINKLKLLLPMILPNTISDNPSKEATELTTNSGAEVPKATMVKPITRSGMWYFFANADAPSTSQLAPKISPKKPTTIRNKAKTIINIYLF